jgi:hypothetical protein
MSSGDGRSRFSFNSVCSALTKHSAQSSQIRSSRSLSLQHKTAISVQTGQKSAYSETRGSRAMAVSLWHSRPVAMERKVQRVHSARLGFWGNKSRGLPDAIPAGSGGAYDSCSTPKRRSVTTTTGLRSEKCFPAHVLPYDRPWARRAQTSRSTKAPLPLLDS